MEEQIDVLNADGTSAGYSCGRSKVHAEGLWHRTVHIWAFDSNKRILFQLRSRVKENNPGLLDTSCAGHISAGDSSVNAAVRELATGRSGRLRVDDPRGILREAQAASREVRGASEGLLLA